MSYRILIVDDSPVMRKLVQRVVEMSGFNADDCFCASNGIEALEVLGSRAVDLILSDINMPRMDGQELMRALKADENFREIPVLILSTDATQKRIRDMFDLGAQGYLTKPFTPEALHLELQRISGGANV